MTPKQKAIEIIEGSFGDDLERAEKLFAHFSPAEMKGMHCNSGKTRQQVLDDWRIERVNRIAALNWVRQQPDLK